MQALAEVPTNSTPPEVRKKCESVVSRSKDELRYWKDKIRRVPASPYFYVELQRDGIRKKLSLETSNAAAAAHRAREIWYEVRSLGWPGYMAKHRPQSLPNPDPSIGEFVDDISKVADLTPKTLRFYVGAVRKIAADIGGYAHDPRKYGASGKGRKAWLERVDGMKLSDLNSNAVQAWKVAFIARAGTDPIAQRSAKVSANSFLRAARSLFQGRLIKHLDLRLPDPLPFSDCEFEQRPSSKYRSSFDILTVIDAANHELAGTDPEAYKVFLLGTMVGLRRKEIDLLEWSSFKWNEGVIRIEPTQYFAPKSEDSIGDVACDAELVQIFRGFQARATGPFVIESDRAPQPGALYNHYRCKPVFDRLIGWLKEHGVRTLKPLHTLRKEFGSVVCATYGIHAASRALRHSAVAITDMYYTDSRKRTSVGLGHLISTDKVVEFRQELIAEDLKNASTNS
jgi:integrase